MKKPKPKIKITAKYSPGYLAFQKPEKDRTPEEQQASERFIERLANIILSMSQDLKGQDKQPKDLKNPSTSDVDEDELS